MMPTSAFLEFSLKRMENQTQLWSYLFSEVFLFMLLYINTRRILNNM